MSASPPGFRVASGSEFGSIPLPGTFIELPNTFARHMDQFNCFGCSPTNRLGMRARFQVSSPPSSSSSSSTAAASAAALEQQRIFRTTFQPSHEFSGFPRLLQGGLMGVLMDCLAEWICMYTFENIGFTTFFELEFVRGVPSPPPMACPSNEPEDTHIRHRHELPQVAAGYTIQVLGKIDSIQGNRIILCCELQDMDSTLVYARGRIHMILPNEKMVCKLFQNDRKKLHGYKSSIEALTKVIHESIEPKRSSFSSTAPSSSASSNSLPSKSFVRPPAASIFFNQIDSPLVTHKDRWLTLIDPLTRHIPDYACFGCGVNNRRGLRHHDTRYEWNQRNGAIRTYLNPTSEWSGFPNMIHGGLAMVPIDCIGAWLIMFHTNRIALTSKIEMCYIEPVRVPEDDVMMGDKNSPTILIQGQLISHDDRKGVAIVNLYDLSSITTTAASSSNPTAPRLCITARLTFTLATSSIVSRLLGSEYVSGTEEAMKEFERFKKEMIERDTRMDEGNNQHTDMSNSNNKDNKDQLDRRISKL